MVGNRTCEMRSIYISISIYHLYLCLYIEREIDCVLNTKLDAYHLMFECCKIHICKQTSSCIISSWVYFYLVNQL